MHNVGNAENADRPKRLIVPSADGVGSSDSVDEDGLDITIRVEISHSVREAQTGGYGFPIPALDVKVHAGQNGLAMS